MNSTLRRNGLVWLLILVAVGALFYSASQSREQPPEKELTEVVSLIEGGRVSKITIAGDQLQVQLVNDTQVYLSHKEPEASLTSALAKLGV